MGKRIVMFLLAVLTFQAGWSQQSDTKKINSIKRNKQYIYAEATMDTEDAAYQVAEELLTTYINEYIESKKKLNQAGSVIVKDITSKCDKIRMMRGDMFRVFVYVKKSDLIPAENALTLVKPEEPATEPDSLESLQEEEGETFSGEIVRNENLKLNVAWQQAVVDELLTASSLTAAKALLNRLKAEYKIKRYGGYNECKNPADCFWLIADSAGIIQTVLGPGTNERTNFKTLQYDWLQNHSGSNAIWFTLSK